jgi:RimJ/RimL family protein N-acetyltransferase
MKNYKIIPITDAHTYAFWQVLDSVAREKKFLSFFEAPPINTTREFIQNNIHNHWPHVVAILDEKIVGWADITSLDRPIFSHAGTLGMGVLAPYRGMGIGRALLHAVIDSATIKGLSRIELTVRELNKNAILLYQKFGFVKEGFHRQAVKVDGQYENHISMALIINDNL